MRRLIAGLVMLLTLLTPVLAKEVKDDGGAVVEIGISGGNELILENEYTTVSFVKRGDGGLSTKVHSTYELYNAGSSTAYAAIAVVRLLHVEEVEVPRENVDSFVSGETITINGETVYGMIYPADEVEDVLEKSAYEDRSDALAHATCGGYMDEAFALYGITSFADHERSVRGNGLKIPQTETVKRYKMVPSDSEGEEMFCMVVYNIEVPVAESISFEVDNTALAEKSRPFKESEKGSKYTFAFNGENLNSFYSVGDVTFKFDFPEDEELGLLPGDTPFFMKDEEYFVHSYGGYKDIVFTLGRELSEDEINDLKASGSPMKYLITVMDIAAFAAVVFSVFFIVTEIRKRMKVGVGLRE